MFSLATVLLLIPLCQSQDVSFNVMKRIYKHANQADVRTLVATINNNTDLLFRRNAVATFTQDNFGEKKSRTESPFDSKNYALHKAWSLMEQRQACMTFLDECWTSFRNQITSNLMKEYRELFWIIDKNNDHLFPATVYSWQETRHMTVSSAGTANKEVILDALLKMNPEAFFYLQHWQLYDQFIETNVLFI